MFAHGLDYFISIDILSNLDPHAGFRRNFHISKPFLMSNIIEPISALKGTKTSKHPAI